MRYNFTETEKRYDGKRVYKTTYYPPIPLDSSDEYIVVADTEYLDSLAKKYYGDESFWWVIANANGLGNGKLSIPPDKQIRIPGNLSRILENMKRIN